MQTSETIHPDKSENDPSARNTVGLGSMHHFEVLNQHFLFFYDCANVSISVLTDFSLRIRVSLSKQDLLESTIAVVGASYLPTSSVTLEDEAHQIVLSTAHFQLTLSKDAFCATIADASGTVYYRTEGVTVDAQGSFTMTNLVDHGQEQGQEQDTHFYGLGEKTGFLDKRGERYEMWNSDIYAPHVPEIEALYTSIPFLIHFTPRLSYGVFLDNPGRTVFDMRGRVDAYTLSTMTGDVDVYVLYGPTMKDVLKRYTALTGRTHIPPKWALGYHQSRYSYMNDHEVLELAKEFREREIPCDVIHLDIHYMNEYRVFTFDRARFPNPKQMINQLGDSGFRVVPIVDPGVKRDPKYSTYREGITRDAFCKKIEGTLFTGQVWPGESAFPDFTDDSIARWWGAQHKFYTDFGIRGIWNDMNEPAVFNESKTMDLDVIHRNNGKPKTHEELHNLYGLLMSKATYEGVSDLLEGERPFILTRASYSGVQRYAAVWTGDNRSFWEHLQMAIPMVLNLGLSGVSFTGPDVGGFAHHASGELLARWTQVGALFPFYRNHSALDTVRQEPWSFGPEVEAICRKYISLRYRLMPYLYSLFYEASETGLPVMRPLILEYPTDAVVTNISDAFLLGSQVMVAPITRPDTEHRAVYLPKGTWYDYWTGERLDGSRHILAHAPLATLPMYVRAGSILPELVNPGQHTGSADNTHLRLSIYAGGAGTNETFTLYEDDGISFAHKDGVFNTVVFKVHEEEGKLVFSYQYDARGYEGGVQKLELVIHGLPFVPKTTDGLVHNEESGTWNLSLAVNSAGGSTQISAE